MTTQLIADGYEVLQRGVHCDSSFIAAGAAGAAATLTLAADSARPWIIGQLAWSYDAAPTGGQIAIHDGAGTVVWRQDITAGGPDGWTFDPPLVFSQNTAVLIGLAAPGGSIIGRVCVNAWKRQ